MHTVIRCKPFKQKHLPEIVKKKESCKTFILNNFFPAIFVILLLLINLISVILQWVCSSLVLLKIRQVKQKISKNKLNQNSANRFRKQVTKIENFLKFILI